MGTGMMATMTFCHARRCLPAFHDFLNKFQGAATVNWKSKMVVMMERLRILCMVEGRMQGPSRLCRELQSANGRANRYIQISPRLLI
ncbi:hypothetical protein WJX74_000040 [Apatococcus lobatus]|uniref:Uncharacterized protein n=1 Tax=Apatococcus lobatus TaxID=904363 RepID=A0AAW1Q5A7_9CHLO